MSGAQPTSHRSQLHRSGGRPKGSELPSVIREEIMDGLSGVEKGIKSLENFERALSHVRNSARPLTLISRDELGACVSTADRAKHNLQLAYGVTSLFYMFLKTQGVAPADHPVKAELDRIRGYFAKLKQVGKPPEQRKLKVDAAASRRFIDNALSGDNVWRSARGPHPRRDQEGGGRTEEGIGRSLPAGQPEGFRSHQDKDRKNRKVVPASSSSSPSSSLPTPGATSLPRGGNVSKRRHTTESGNNDENDSNSVGILGKRKKQLGAAAAAAGGGARGVGGSREDNGSRGLDGRAKHGGFVVGGGGDHRSTQGASSKSETKTGMVRGNPKTAGVDAASRKTRRDHQRRK